MLYFILYKLFVLLRRATDESEAERRAKEREQARRAFELFDEDGSGSIDAEELRALSVACGLSMTLDEARAQIHAADDDGNETLDFDEFLRFWESGGSVAASGSGGGSGGSGAEEAMQAQRSFLRKNLMDWEAVVDAAAQSKFVARRESSRRRRRSSRQPLLARLQATVTRQRRYVESVFGGLVGQAKRLRQATLLLQTYVTQVREAGVHLSDIGGAARLYLLSNASSPTTELWPLNDDALLVAEAARKKHEVHQRRSSNDDESDKDSDSNGEQRSSGVAAVAANVRNALKLSVAASESDGGASEAPRATKSNILRKRKTLGLIERSSQ